MRKYGILFICAFHLVIVQAQDKALKQYKGHPIVKNYPIKDLGSQIFNIVQDDRGVMYFGMGKGVVVYDGKYWREIPLPSKTQAFSFAKSKEGIIYVAGIGHFGYLSLNAQGKTVFEDLTPLVKKKILIGEVFSVRNTSKFVYFHTMTHIFQYDKNRKEITIFEGEPNGFGLGNFVMEDTYYFSGLEKGLLKIEDNQIVNAPHSDFFKDQVKTQFLFGASPFDAQTQLIIGDNPNIHLYSPSTTSPKSLLLESQDFLKDNFPYTSTPSQDSRYHFLGSVGKGGILIDKKGNILQQYNKQTGLSTDEIQHVYVDKQQNFWLGLNNGLNKTEHSLDLIHWRDSHHFEGDIYYAYLHQNKLYVLTSKEIFVIAPDKKMTILKDGSINNQKWGMELFHFGNASKMIFAAGGSIYEIAGSKAIEIYNSKNGQSPFFIHKSKKNPNRLISTEGNALVSLRYEKNQWVEEGIWKGMGRDNFRTIAETETGEIWLGTLTKGLVKVIPNFKDIKEPLKVSYYGLEQGLPSLYRCVPIVYQDKLLVGTEKGLYIYLPQKDRFEAFCGFGKQFCDGSIGVFHFVETKDGKIYLAPPVGHVSCLIPNPKGGYDQISQPFKRIPHMSIRKMEVDSQGAVWIVGEEGIFRYDAQQDTKDYKQSFNCLIRKVLIDKDSVIYWGNDKQKPNQQNLPIHLPYQHHDVKFEFAAPFFEQEDKTLYSYYLEGNDKKWSDWSTQTEKEYTNLWEGTYSFQAKAKNIYDVESIVGAYSFTILPPWYRTWWAFVIYLVFVIVAIIVASKAYHYSLIKKKLMLQKIIRNRTLQIKEQNNELQRQKEKLEIQAENLVQLNNTKDKLFAILGHDLRSPINTLVGLLDLVSQKAISPQELQLYTDKLIINVKQVHFTLNNLLFWAKGQMQGLASNPQFFELNGLIENNFNLVLEIALEKRIVLINLIQTTIIVFADKDQVDMVLRNLLNNAIKFTPLDGTIRIGAELKSGFWQIFVQDSGMGIAPENMGKIFKANAGYTTSGTAGEKGTGLGLSMCQEMIEMNGGKIWVESELGRGTTIFFTIPMENQ